MPKLAEPNIRLMNYKVNRIKGLTQYDSAIAAGYPKKDKQVLLKKVRLELKPWLMSFYEVNERCKDGGAYSHRDLKSTMTAEDFEFIWWRDLAYLMEKPSVDRIDPDKGYSIDNCRYMELRDNQRRPHSRFGKKNLYKGVTKIKTCNRWAGQVCINYKNYYLGLFDTPEKAKIAVDEFRKEKCLDT